MKKQIFILVSLIFTFGITKSYGQYQTYLSGAPTCITPTTITCLTGDALKPIAGTPYTYSVNVPNPVGAKTYTWFVTQDVNFIKYDVPTNKSILNYTTILGAESGTSSSLMSPSLAADVSNYANQSSASASISITWKSFNYVPANPVFVVIHVKNTPPSSCTTENIQVYKIEPQNGFTLDLQNLKYDGSAGGANLTTCVAPITSAVYNPASNSGAGAVDMIYGINYLYFIVSAANFTNAWKPSFLLDAASSLPSGTDTRTITVDWAYPDQAILSTGVWHTTTPSAYAQALGGTEFNSTDLVVAKATSGTVNSAGECIIMRVTLDNKQDENISGYTFNFYVDGLNMLQGTTAGTYDVVGKGDIHFTAGPDAATIPAQVCPWIDGYTNDLVTQTVSARPEVNTLTPDAANTGVLPFILKK